MIKINNWQRAFTLASFDLRASVKQILLLILVYFSIFIVMVTSLTAYFNNGSFIFDLFFISVFAGVATSWARNGTSYSSDASSRFIMFQQFPIKQATIIKSWFISCFIYTLPLLMILLVSLYAASSKLKMLMSPLTYCCFSIVLLCFAVITVDTIPTDRAKKFDGKITKKRFLTLIFSAALLITLFIFTQFYSRYGIIHLLIILIQKQPLLITSLSLILTITFLRHRYLKMKKQITTIDYL